MGETMTSAMLSHKRKRDKAQDQLRSRMRQRRDAGHGTSSTLLQARRGYSIRDGRGDTSLSGGMIMNQSSSIAVTPGDLLSSSHMHWKTPPDQLNNSGGVDSALPQSNVKGPNPISMQELIKRVLQRKVDNLELGSSTLPIRNFKSRRVPYAVRHSSHVKKIVGTMPKHKTKEDDIKPVVMVVEKEQTNDVQHRSKSYPRLKNSLNPLQSIENIPHAQASVHSFKNTSAKKEPKTHLVLANQTNPIGQPITGDEEVTNRRQAVTNRRQEETNRRQDVTNRRQQVTKTIKVTLQHRDSTKQTLNKRTMHKSKPLPAIKSATSRKQDPSLTSRLIEDAVIKSKSRCSSGDEILNLKSAQSEAIQKLGQLGEPTLLGTPRRFTDRMVRFKKDLGKVDKLSSIDEGRR